MEEVFIGLVIVSSQKLVGALHVIGQARRPMVE